MAAQEPLEVGVMLASLCDRRGGALRRLQKSCQTALGIFPRLNVPGGTVADSQRRRTRVEERQEEEQG